MQTRLGGGGHGGLDSGEAAEFQILVDGGQCWQRTRFAAAKLRRALQPLPQVLSCVHTLLMCIHIPSAQGTVGSSERDRLMQVGSGGSG